MDKKIVFIIIFLLGLSTLFLSEKYIFRKNDLEPEITKANKVNQNKKEIIKYKEKIISTSPEESNKMIKEISKEELVEELTNNMFSYKSIEERNNFMHQHMTKELYSIYKMPDQVDGKPAELNKIESKQIYFSEDKEKAMALVKVDSGNIIYTVLMEVSFIIEEKLLQINAIQIYNVDIVND